MSSGLTEVDDQLQREPWTSLGASLRLPVDPRTPTDVQSEDGQDDALMDANAPLSHLCIQLEREPWASLSASLKLPTGSPPITPAQEDTLVDPCFGLSDLVAQLEYEPWNSLSDSLGLPTSQTPAGSNWPDDLTDSDSKSATHVREIHLSRKVVVLDDGRLLHSPSASPHVAAASTQSPRLGAWGIRDRSMTPPQRSLIRPNRTSEDTVSLRRSHGPSPSPSRADSIAPPSGNRFTLLHTDAETLTLGQAWVPEWSQDGCESSDDGERQPGTAVN